MSDADPFGKAAKRGVFDPDAPIAKTSAAQQFMSEFAHEIDAEPPAAPADEQALGGDDSAAAAPAKKKFVPRPRLGAKSAAAASAAADGDAPAEDKPAPVRPKFVRPARPPAAAAAPMDEIFIAEPKSRPQTNAVAAPAASAFPPGGAAPAASSSPPLPAAAAAAAGPSSDPDADPFGTGAKMRAFDPDAPIAKTSAAQQFMSEFPPGHEDGADALLDDQPAAPKLKPKPKLTSRKPLVKKSAPAPAAASSSDVSTVAASADDNGADADAVPPASTSSMSNSPPLKARPAPAAASSMSAFDASNELPPGEEGGAEEVFSGPLETRLVHKNWKARVQAYDEMKAELEAVDADDDDARKTAADRFAPFLKKIVNDVSMPALESGLQAVAAWVDKASFDHGAAQHADDIMGGLLKKGFGSARAGTKAAADTITLLLVECSAAESVMTHLITGTQSNVPKIASACASLLVSGLRDYGPGVIAFDKMQKALPKILAHVNNQVRQEAMDLAVELYRWMGNIFTNHLKSIGLKKAQEDQLNTMFEKVTLGQARPVKVVRSEAGKAAVGGKKGKGGAAADAPFDPMALVKPVDIAAKLPKGWNEKAVGAPKWQEKKERLTELLTLAEASAKIELSPALIDVIGSLKKCLKDSNVVIVGDALKCICALAKGTRRSFYTYARQLFPTLIQLLKEKKSNVSVPLTQCLDTMAELGVVEIPEVLDSLVEGLGDKVSKVRIEVCQFLQRWIEQPRINEKSLKDATKPLGEALYKVLNDPEKQTVGRRPVADIFKRLQTPEMVKRMATLEQLISASKKNTSSSSSSGGADAETVEEEAAPAAAAKATSGKGKSLPPKRPGSNAPAAAASVEEKKPAATSSSSSSVGASKIGAVGAKKPSLGKPSRVERPGSATTLPSVGGADPAAVDGNGHIRKIDVAAKAARIKRDTKRIKGAFREWGSDELEELNVTLHSLCSDELHALLFHKDFAKQVAGIDLLEGELAANMDAVTACSDLLLKYLSWRLCDANTSMLIKVLQFIKLLLTAWQSSGYKLSDGEASNLLPFLIEKVFGHNTDRFRNEAVQLLTLLDDIYQPKAVMAALVVGFDSKNKRVFSECLKEAGNMIVKYGVAVCDKSDKKILLSMAAAVGASESHVRQSALTALGAIYEHKLGEGIWTYLGGRTNNTKIAPKVMTMIEGRFKTIQPAAQAQSQAEESTPAASAATNAAATAAAAALLARKEDLTRTPRRAPTAASKSSIHPQRSPGESPASRSAQVSPRNSISGGSLQYGARPSATSSSVRMSGPASSSSSSSLGSGISNLPNCFSLDLGDSPSGSFASDRDHGLPSMQVSRTAPNSPGRSAVAAAALSHSVQSATTSPLQVKPAAFSKALGRPQLVVPTRTAGGAGSSSSSNDPALMEQLLHYMDSSYSSHLSEDEKMDVMRQLWEIVQDNRPAVAEQGDEIVAFLTRQIEVSFTESVDGGVIEVNHRHCRYALNTLLEIFKVEEMAQTVRVHTLEHLTRLLLLKLMDDRLRTHPDHQCRSLTMAVNVLVLKVLENSDRTATFHTLLKFLGKGSGTGSMGDATNKTFVDLVVRSLMKMTKNFSNAKFLQGLHVPSLLRDIHEYMSAHPSAHAQVGGGPAPADDLPIKALKAMLSGLANVKGEELRRDFGRDIPASSPVVAYVEKMIAYNNKQRGVTGGATTSGTTIDSRPAAASALPSVSAPSSLPSVEPVVRRLQLDEDDGGLESNGIGSHRRLTPSISDSKIAPLSTGVPGAVAIDVAGPAPSLPLDPVQQLLSEIVARTIKPATTQTALRELYEFTLAHPRADIWPAFHLQGDSFKAYVKRNLTRMQAEGPAAFAPTPRAAAAITPSPSPMSAAPVGVEAPLPSPASAPIAAALPSHSRNVSSVDASATGAGANTSSTALYRMRLSVLQDRAKIATAATAAGASASTPLSAHTPSPSPMSASLPSATGVTASAQPHLSHTVSMSSIDAIRARFKSARNDENSAPVAAHSDAATAAVTPTAASVPPPSTTVSSIDAIKARIAAMNKNAGAH